MLYQYPLNIRFKLLALAPRMYVTDANGQNVLFISQKVLALKEDVRVYSDESKTNQVYGIRADKILDFSARYNFTDSSAGRPLGSVKHKGFRSIWKATYLVADEIGNDHHQITEDNPWIKVADALFNEIPVINLFTGYLFHPSYTAHEIGSERPIMRLDKLPSFFERTYQVDMLAPDVDPVTEQRILLAFMMMIQLERSRG